MTHPGGAGCDRKPLRGYRLAFMAAGLMSLLVVLLCALVPMESATAREVGSAFDPATTVVTLRPESQGAPTIEPRLAPTPDDDRPCVETNPQRDPTCLPPGSPAFIGGRIGPFVDHPYDEADQALASLSARTFRARAPPSI